MKHTAKVVFVLVAAIAPLVIVIWILFAMPHAAPASKHAPEATHIMQIAGKNIAVTISDTPEAQEKGLGGRSGLAPDEGMLFVFPQDGDYAFWMKDMIFPIDIVWLSVDGRVITIAHDVSPDTYPKTFSPARPARYVVELPAGFSAAHGVKEGDTVRL